MIQSQIKVLDDSELIEQIRHAKDVLDLCVHGVINSDYPDTADGLYWAYEDLNLLTEELQERFVANDKKGEVSKNDMSDLNTNDALEVFFEGLRVLRRTGRHERASAYLDRFLDVLLEKKAKSD